MPYHILTAITFFFLYQRNCMKCFFFFPRRVLVFFMYLLFHLSKMLFWGNAEKQFCHFLLYLLFTINNIFTIHVSYVMGSHTQPELPGTLGYLVTKLGVSQNRGRTSSITVARQSFQNISQYPRSLKFSIIAVKWTSIYFMH